ncbi:MAG: HAD family hydrolase [Clostridiales bacterium]|nr:HAD family hydrolase [Clostridiales bacterium]
MADHTTPKTLYVSDLDGTLMRNDETLSKETIRIINELVEKGLPFTYATARSVESARPIAGGLNLKLPVVTRNGAVLADNSTGEHIKKSVFSDEEVSLLKELLTDIPYCGYVSCFIEKEMIRTTMEGKHSVGLQSYLDYYKDDPTMKYMDSYDEMFCGLPGYVTCIGEKEEIEPIYDRVRAYDRWEALFQRDTYRDEYWLEICPKNCTKAKSLLKLKEDYGFDRLVVFGDSLNDISMFKIADEAYAVSNARDELKKLATGIIGCNEDDAVAYYLQDLMNKKSKR